MNHFINFPIKKISQFKISSPFSCFWKKIYFSFSLSSNRLEISLSKFSSSIFKLASVFSLLTRRSRTQFSSTKLNFTIRKVYSVPVLPDERISHKLHKEMVQITCEGIFLHFHIMNLPP